VSPVIGCQAKCVYCYLPISGINKKVRPNSNEIDIIIDSITSDANFIKGQKGSIISVGAWGDIFPLGNEGLVNNSIDWIINLLKIGNPVQIMSKFTISEKHVHKICDSIQYKGQLLYSTTVTTFKKWDRIECNSSSPQERLITLHTFKKNNVPTNVMIKPLIPGITDSEIDLFEYYLKKYEVDYCVVGILFWTNELLNRLSKYGNNIVELASFKDSSYSQILDCTGNSQIDAFSSNDLDAFVNNLRNKGINAFKKSSCINSNMLKINNISKYYKNDPRNFCIKCGNCSEIL